MPRLLPIILLVALSPLAAADKTAADHLQEARAHYEADRLEAAAEAARAALALAPDEAEAHYLLGASVRWGADSRDEVETALKRAVELQPETAAYHQVLGSFYRQTQRPELALAAYQRAVALDADNLEAVRAVAMLARDLKRWAEAEAAYRRVMELEPNEEITIREAARAAAAQKRLPEAEELYLQAIGLIRNVQELQALANEAVPHELWAVVKAVGVRILNEELGPPLGHYLLGVAYERQQKLPLAEMSYRQTTRLASHEPLAWLHLGRVLRLQRRWAESEASLQAALGRHQNLADAHNELGVLMFDQGRLADAVPHYARAAELAPTNPTILYNQGKTLLDLGRHAEAEAILRKLLTLTGPHEQVQELLDQAVAAQAQPAPAPAG